MDFTLAPIANLYGIIIVVMGFVIWRLFQWERTKKIRELRTGIIVFAVFTLIFSGLQIWCEADLASYPSGDMFPYVRWKTRPIAPNETQEFWLSNWFTQQKFSIDLSTDLNYSGFYDNESVTLKIRDENSENYVFWSKTGTSTNKRLQLPYRYSSSGAIAKWILSIHSNAINTTLFLDALIGFTPGFDQALSVRMIVYSTHAIPLVFLSSLWFYSGAFAIISLRRGKSLQKASG
jgi:hypothetical protein